MCKFFSLVSDGHGSIRYFGAKERTEIEEQGNPKDYKFDSHASICDYFEINEDKCNKYEYNPFTKKINIDQINNENDSAHVEKQVRKMDFNPIFETGLFDIDLSELESLDGIELPEKYKLIYLDSIKKLENFTFPEECNNIDLESCTELKNVILPKECFKLCLSSLESLENVTLPKKMTGFLDLSSLKSLENVTLPEEFNNLYLNLINSSEVVLPKKHGKIMFKNKCVYSNL